MNTLEDSNLAPFCQDNFKSLDNPFFSFETSSFDFRNDSVEKTASNS